MSKQWEDDSDLLTVHRDVKVALCYDFKRRPVNPVDFDGLIQFQTEPWETLDECQEARNDFDSWKNTAHRGAQDSGRLDRVRGMAADAPPQDPMRPGRRSRTPW